MREAAVEWQTRWENDLSPGDHRAIAETLRASLGGLRAQDATHFDGGRSWAGGRPELRMFGHDEKGVTAHIGVLRRFLRIGGADVLVADLGMLAVRPDLQGAGLGGDLLAALRKVLGELAVPYGFLTARAGLTGFYVRNGWTRLPEGTAVRYADSRDPRKIVTFGEAAFLLSVAEPLAAWPRGDVIDRNGLEV